MDLTQFEHQYEQLARDVGAFKRAISTKLMYTVGKDPVSARPEDWLHAVSHAVRVAYLSMPWVFEILFSMSVTLKALPYLDSR